MEIAVRKVMHMLDFDPKYSEFLLFSDNECNLLKINLSGYQDRNRAYNHRMYSIRGVVYDMVKQILICPCMQYDLCFNVRHFPPEYSAGVEICTLKGVFKPAWTFDYHKLSPTPFELNLEVDLKSTTYHPHHNGHLLVLFRYGGRNYLSSKNKLDTSNSNITRTKDTFLSKFLELLEIQSLEELFDCSFLNCSQIAHFTLGNEYFTKGCKRRVQDSFLVLTDLVQAPFSSQFHKSQIAPMKLPELKEENYSLPLGCEANKLFKLGKLSWYEAREQYLNRSEKLPFYDPVTMRDNSSGISVQLASPEQLSWACNNRKPHPLSTLKRLLLAHIGDIWEAVPCIFKFRNDPNLDEMHQEFSSPRDQWNHPIRNKVLFDKKCHVDFTRLETLRLNAILTVLATCQPQVAKEMLDVCIKELSFMDKCSTLVIRLCTDERKRLDLLQEVYIELDIPKEKSGSILSDPLKFWDVANYHIQWRDGKDYLPNFPKEYRSLWDNLRKTVENTRRRSAVFSEFFANN